MVGKPKITYSGIPTGNEEGELGATIVRFRDDSEAFFVSKYGLAFAKLIRMGRNSIVFNLIEISFASF
jgi:hypothetical protein